MEGLFILLRFILGYFFARLAANSLRAVVANRFLRYMTAFAISFIIVVFFPAQDYVSLTTGIILSFIFPFLSELWRRRRYAAVIYLSIIITVVTWWILYPIDLTGKLICLMFLGLGWLIAKHEILIDFLGRLFID